METHKTRGFNVKSPQSKKLTTQEKGLLVILVNEVNESYKEKLKSKEIDEMFKKLLTEQLNKYEEIERKLK